MKEQILTNLGTTIIFVFIVVSTVILGLIISFFFKRLIKRSTDILKNDPTNYQFLRHAVNATIYIIGFGLAIYSVPNLRALASSILAGAGILAVAIGFASQQVLSNIISGFFIVIFKPFRVNDQIKIKELTGSVEDITLRHTVVRNFENKRIIVPNSVMSNEVITNSDFSGGEICKWIEIGISYDSDITLAKKIIKQEILAHPLHIDPRTDLQKEENIELAPVKVVGLGEYSVNLKAWAWAENTANAFLMYCDLLESIKNKFDAEKIEIPFPHRTIVYKNDNKSIN